MKPSLLKLKKFLKLEAERGYDNRAVLGGLENMLDPWEAEARAEELPQDLVEAVVSRLRDYHRLTEPSREEALQGLWRRIQRSAGEIETQPLPAARLTARSSASQVFLEPGAPTSRLRLGRVISPSTHQAGSGGGCSASAAE